jgi:hypothetical protein
MMNMFEYVGGLYQPCMEQSMVYIALQTLLQIIQVISPFSYWNNHGDLGYPDFMKPPYDAGR